MGLAPMVSSEVLSLFSAHNNPYKLAACTLPINEFQAKSLLHLQKNRNEISLLSTWRLLNFRHDKVCFPIRTFHFEVYPVAIGAKTLGDKMESICHCCTVDCCG